MLSKFLFFVLTKFFKVDPKMCNPCNWRVAHPAEPISMVLKYSPLIFKVRYSEPKYGFENFVILAAGRVYLMSNKTDQYPAEMSGSESESDKTIRKYQGPIVMLTLVQYYMKIKPNIVVKKFPCRILRYLLKQQIKVQKPIIEDFAKRMIGNVPKDLKLAEAIKDDLFAGRNTILPGGAEKYARENNL